MPRTAMHSRRSRPSCSVIALATVLAVGATPATAQSFNGTGEFVNGTGSISTGAGTTTIDITSQQAVIDWTPTDNATNTTANIVFQNAGTTATFSSESNFAVLNNIDSASISRAIEMNGTVRARVGGLQRGSVYFYAPGGFVLGGGSAFSVGSLVLSALPIAYDANGFITNFGTENTVQFGQAPNPSAAIASAGSISANVVTSGVPSSSNSSYVALVAPRVQHTGSILVNGSAALVAAEAATMSFSPDGLFDISVTVGTDDPNGVVVSGDIGGTTPNSVDNQHRVYLVAVPKNDALTMVISNGADLGFTLANNASIDQYGAVILSAGHDISNGDIGAESAGSNAAANFWFTGAHATNNLFGEATGYADLYSTDAQASQMVTVFDSDVTVHADDHVLMNASGEGSTLTVGGNLFLSTSQFATEIDGSAQGGVTTLSADSGGSLTVTGNASLTANGLAGSTESPGETGGTGTGGQVNLQSSSGGNLHVIGNVGLETNGTGGSSFDGNGGAGFGGAVANGGGVNITANAGALTVDGDLTASAEGRGGQASTAGTTSGTGTGGDIFMSASSDGDVSIAGNTSIKAEGWGGIIFNDADGGDGQGGSVSLHATGTGSTFSLAGALISANGEGGGPGEGSCCVGGDGVGGLVSLTGSNGALITSNGTLEFSAAGSGGYGGVAGGDGIGGDNEAGRGVFINAENGLTFNVTGDLWLDGTGSGGDSDGTAGDGSGGYAGLHVNGGTVNVTGELSVDADGFGGGSESGGNGGNGTGGLAEVLLTGGSLTVGGRLLVVAGGTGGDGDNIEGPLGNGGDGTGGSAGVFANGGALHVLGNLEISSDGAGGFGDTGGNGLGKWAELFASGGGTVDIDGTALISASGFGGEGHIGGAGHGGGELFEDGTGVDGAHIFAQNGSINIDGATTILADGQGANGGTGDFESDGGAGGAASAGWAGVTAANSNSGPSSITLSTLNISASASGGDGGQGGSGNQGGNGGAGADATAGDVTVFANAGNGHLTVTSSVVATAIATGGRGGDGGNGDGLAGGSGGAGGNAVGGHVQVGTASGNGQAAADNLGTATYGSIIADTSATGGDGGDGNFGSPEGTGGDGGTGDGGASVLLVRGSTVTVNGSTQLIANGQGGDGGLGGGELGGGGAGGDGLAGEVAVVSTARYQIPTQHGTLNAGSITGTAAGVGGLGSTDGSGIVEGGSSFEIDSSTVNIGSLNFNITGDSADPSADPSFIRITNATVDVDSTFAFSTIGDLSFYIDNGSLGSAINRVDSLVLSAGNFVADAELDDPANVGTAFATNLSVTSDGDFIADANLDVVNGIDITVPGSILFDNAVSDSFVDLWAQGGSIDIGNVDAGGSVSLVADSFITGGNIDAGGAIFAQTFGGNIDLGSLTSTFGSIFVDAAGDVDLGGDALADGDIEVSATGDIVMLNAMAGESVDLSADGNVTALNLTGGDSVDIDAGGAVEVDNLSAGLVNPSTNEGADYVAAILAGGNILAGNIEAAQHIGLAAPGTITTGTIDADGIFMALGTGNMLFLDTTAGSEVYLADFSMMELGGEITDEFDPNPILASLPTRTGGSITIGDVTTGRFTAAAGTSLTTGIIDSDSDITLDAGAAILTEDLFAGNFVLANGGSITTQNIEANSVDMTSTGGNITINGDVFAFGGVTLDAFGDIQSGDITAGSIDLLAGDDITTDDLTTQFLQVLAQDGPITTLLFPGASITLEAGGDIETGNINSIDGVYANAGGSITTGNVEALDFIWMFAGTDMDLGNLNAGEDIDLESGVNPGSGGNMAFGDVSAGTEFDFEADGNVEGGDVVAGATIEGEASGNVLLGALTAGFDPGEFIDDDNFSVGIVAEGSINVGNVSGAEDVGFGTLGNLTTGNLSGGDLIITLVQGNITTGSITTNGEVGQVYMAHASMCETGGGCSAEGDFDPDIVLALEPVPTGGSITINGPVNTGLFRAAAGTTLTTQSVNAEDALAFAGGLAVINGAWTVGDAKITSNDIDITANGSISANGDISLVSKNTTRTVVGDGLNLAGYNLSSAEFGKLGANDITILADTAEGAAPTMFIGTLNANAGGFPDGIDYEFLTGNGDTETASGSIRVAGNAVFTGMTSENHSVNFSTGLFQLVTEIGSISLFSSGSTLGGELGIAANRVHVASASILNKLASDPTYTNYQQDLNETPDVQRPEGVLRADTISIGSDNLQDVLIQNTGTGFQGGTPAGFLARQLFINGGEGAGSINLVINGQVVSEGGTLTGVEARDALVPEGTDITPFTSNSTINGCPLTGVCIIPPPPAPPAADIVDNFIDIITGDALGDSDFGNEDDIDDNEEGDQGADNPINPPQPLFDTRPLIPSGDVNDPVSGTGNPALLGSDQQCEEGEQGQCPANPVEGDSQ